MHRNDIVEGAGQQTGAAIFFGRDDEHAGAARARVSFVETCPMPVIGGPETEVHDVRAPQARFVDRAYERRNVRRQALPEDLDRDELGGWRFLANRRGDRGAMPEAIDVVGVERSIVPDRDAAGHAAHMWMTGVNAAVDDRDAHALPAVLG